MPVAPEHFIVLASAARTAAVNSSDYLNFGHRGIHLVIDATAETGTAEVTVTIQGKDANGIYYDVLVGTAITATGTTVLKVYPGISPSANSSANDVLPPIWRVKVTVADSDSLTYSVGANLLV